jgi:hypothetical protein
VSAETVSTCAVRWTSRTSGQRPTVGAVGRGARVVAEHPPGSKQGDKLWQSRKGSSCSSTPLLFP